MAVIARDSTPAEVFGSLHDIMLEMHDVRRRLAQSTSAEGSALLAYLKTLRKERDNLARYFTKLKGASINNAHP